MSLKKALLIACLLILPGVLVRVTPYLDRVTGWRSDNAPAVREAEGSSDKPAPAPVPSRLSKRPVVLVALGFATEVGLYVILITWLLRSRRFLRQFDAVVPAARIAGMIFLAVLFCGFLGGVKETFPFFAWRMYSGQPEGSPNLCFLEGRLRSGDTVRFKSVDVLPILKRYRAYAFVDHRARKAGEAGDVGSDAKSELSVALLALARLYNLQHPADPLQSLSANIGTIPLGNAEPPWVRDSTVIATVEVD